MSKGPPRPASRCHKPQLMLVMLGPGAHYDGIWVVWEGFSPFFCKSLHHFPAIPKTTWGGGLGGGSGLGVGCMGVGLGVGVGSVATNH